MWRFCPPAGEPVLAQPADADDDTVRISADSVSTHGEVYTLTHDAFLRFPPAVAHGIEKIAPFFIDAWAK